LHDFAEDADDAVLEVGEVGGEDARGLGVVSHYRWFLTVICGRASSVCCCVGDGGGLLLVMVMLMLMLVLVLVGCSSLVQVSFGRDASASGVHVT
jgi:hypothetical protein